MYAVQYMFHSVNTALHGRLMLNYVIVLCKLFQILGLLAIYFILVVQFVHPSVSAVPANCTSSASG